MVPAGSLPDVGYLERLKLVTEDDLIIGLIQRLTRWSTDGYSVFDSQESRNRAMWCLHTLPLGITQAA